MYMLFVEGFTCMRGVSHCTRVTCLDTKYLHIHLLTLCLLLLRTAAATTAAATTTAGH
jgi:hypothetical protein